MKKIKNKILAVAASAAFLFSSVCIGNLTAYASTGEKITKVHLTFDYDISLGQDDSNISVTTDDSEYSVDSVDFTNNDDDGWTAGSTPKVKIVLDADNDYYFSSSSKSMFTFKGDDATYVSASRSDSNHTLTLTVKLAKVKAEKSDLEITEANWENESSAEASWETVDAAKSYQVRLYRGNSSVTSIIDTTNTSYNFSNYITKTGEYMFKVRAIYSSTVRGDWFESDCIYVDDNNLGSFKSGSSGSTPTSSTNSSTGAWLKDSTGWWYCNPDRSYTVNNWQHINNQWYFFNTSGYMVTGWVNWNSKWYYCGSNGAMLANTTTPDGYHVGSDGAWIQ